MKLALTEREMKIHNFLKDTEGEKFTAYQVADSIGEKRSAINVLINGLVRKGCCVRETVETEVDGKTAEVKYIVLTDEGRAYDHDSAVAHDAAEAEAAKEAKKAERAAKKATKEAEAE